MIIALNILYLVIGFLILSKSNRRYSSYVNHLNIFSYIWVTITLGTQIFYKDLIDFDTVVIYYISWYCFMIGSSLYQHKMKFEKGENLHSFAMLKFLIFSLVIFCFISNYELLNMISQVGDVQAWADKRKDRSFEEIESNIFNTIFQRSYLVYIPLGIYLFKNKKLSLVLLVILISTGVVFSLLKFTRAPFFQLLIVILITYVYVYNKKLPLFLIILGVVAVFAIFGVSMYFLSGGDSKFNAFDDVKVYLFAGQVVFQDILTGKYQDNLIYDNNYFTFDSVNYILKKSGFIKTYPSYVREWSSTIVTNTYTYLDAFVYDFGIPGAFIGSFIIGFISDTSYYFYNKRKNIFSLIFYGYICYYCAFIFANNEFIRFSVLLVFITLVVYHLISKKRLITW